MVVWRLAIASALLTGLVATSTRAAGDPVVVRDTRVCRVFALGTTILYERNALGHRSGCTPGSWVRLVNGHRHSVHHLPRGAMFHKLFGYPAVTVDQMIECTADWIGMGGATWNKPTHFEVRDGKF